MEQGSDADGESLVAGGDGEAALADGDDGLLFGLGGGGFVLDLKVALENAKFLVELADLLAQGGDVVRRRGGGLGLRGERREGDGGERSGIGRSAGDILVPHGRRVLGLGAWELPVVGSVGCGCSELVDTNPSAGGGRERGPPRRRE